MKEPAHDDERLSARDGHMEDRERDTPAIDDERLSTLLENRLTDLEREELLAHLDAHEEEYDVLAEAAAILLAMEKEEGEEDVTPGDEPAERTPGDPGRKAPPKRAAAVATTLRAYSVRRPLGSTRGDSDDLDSDFPEPSDDSEPSDVPEPPEFREPSDFREPPDAAGPVPPRAYPLPTRTGGWRRRAAKVITLLVVVVAGGLLVRGRPSPGTDAVVLAASLNGPLPADWTQHRDWGSGPRGPAEARSVRAGVLMVDLSVAVRTRDAVRTRELASNLRAQYLSGEAQSGPLQQLVNRAGAPTDSLQPLLEQAAKRIEARLGSGPVRAGAWVEAALLAAHAKDKAFFRADSTGAPPRALEGLAKNYPAVRGALTEVRAQLPGNGPPVWEDLSKSLKKLLHTIDR